MPDVTLFQTSSDSAVRRTIEHFSASYPEARAKFLAACNAKGATIETFAHPLKGPDGGEIATDIGFLGRRDAKNLLILVSGTHGLELLAGSGCQIAWLDEFDPAGLGNDVAVLLIHAINPWGAAWSRRQTEDNVDLNRNFLDFSAPRPANPGYAELGDAIDCVASEAEREAADAMIQAFRRTKGEKAFNAAIYQGQYSHPKGLFYGGAAPTWSNRTFYQILDGYAASAQRIAHVDYHTGLGSYGYGVLITTSEDGSPELAASRGWYGPSIAALKADNDMPYDVQGDLMGAVAHYLPAKFVVSGALEFGTFAMGALFQQLVDEMRAFHSLDAAEGLESGPRTAMKHFFYPGTADWFEMIHARSRQVVRQSIAGLRVDT